MSDGPILFHNVMQISDGHLEDYRHAVRKAVDFVKAHGPQLMVQVFIDEERMLGHSFQLYADSAAILTHWRLADPHIQDVMAHCTVQRLDVFGQPSQEILERMAGMDFPMTVVTTFTGFLR